MFNQSFFGCALFSFLAVATLGGAANARGGESSAARERDINAASIGVGIETGERTSPARDGDVVRLADAPFKATGTHTCYKEGTSFRPTCEVSGGGFANCDAAQAALKADDCCPRNEEGTRSYSFSMTTCGPE